MITATKSFGSYILKKPVFSINEATQNDSTAHGNTFSSLSNATRSYGCAISGEWTALPLISVRKYNHDTSIFKFHLPSGLAFVTSQYIYMYILFNFMRFNANILFEVAVD